MKKLNGIKILETILENKSCLDIMCKDCPYDSLGQCMLSLMHEVQGIHPGYAGDFSEDELTFIQHHLNNIKEGI